MDDVNAATCGHRIVAIDPMAGPLLTDLYQLTMLQAYYLRGMDRTASFELFVRKLPKHRGFLMAAGLELLLDWLELLQFSEAELAWLHRSKLFRPDFVDWLGKQRFHGSVEAMDEGTPFFAEEPTLRVSASIAEAQLIESRLVNLMHVHTLLASKAARSVLAAPAKQLVDFGMRRAHGTEAAIAAARSSYIAGFAGTSLVLAGSTLGTPVLGTMAHSFVQAHLDEKEAFIAFGEAFPENAILLIDTYDTEAAARKVVEIAPRLIAQGIRVKGVRLDSGDFNALARSVRRILDEGGLSDAIIFASGNLDEFRLQELERAAAPINGYGVGTSLVTSIDAPALDMVYKLQEYDGRACRKRSAGKATWPGREQVFRFFDGHGHMSHDEVALMSDHRGDESLLHPVMREGNRLRPRIPLDTIRNYARQSLAQLPAHLREIEAPESHYHVVVAQSVRELAEAVDRGTR